jgi:hypothetical protein
MTHEQIIKAIEAEIKELEARLERLSDALFVVEEFAKKDADRTRKMLATLPGNKLAKPAKKKVTAAEIRAEMAKPLKFDSWSELQSHIVGILHDGPATSGDIIGMLNLRDNKQAKQAVYNITSKMVANSELRRNVDTGVLSLINRDSVKTMTDEEKVAFVDSH